MPHILHIIVQHRAGRVMVCRNFPAAASVQLTIAESTIHSSVFQTMFEANGKLSGKGNLKRKQNLPLQQDGDLKKSQGLTENEERESPWSCQTPDFDPNEMLQGDVKRDVNASNPSKVSQLKVRRLGKSSQQMATCSIRLLFQIQQQTLASIQNSILISVRIHVYIDSFCLSL